MKTQQYLNDHFVTTFNKEPQIFLSCGGRFEVLGNHTDHNHGLCIAATCDLTIDCAASKRDDKIVKILSEGFGYHEIDLSSLDIVESEIATPASLIRGICHYINEEYEYGGFDIYLKSNIPTGAGVSSSAAFEMLIAKVINELFNNGQIPYMTLCKAAQHAEREYYGKKCGLLDQIGVSAGGLVYIDFKDIANPVVETLQADFKDYQFVIVNTGGSHSHLSPLYEAISEDMFKVADYFKKGYLRETDYEQLKKNKADIIEKCGELAYQRARHFFNENLRVNDAYSALKENNIARLIKLMNESRESSTDLLQNMFVDKKKGSPLEACELIRKASHNKAGVKINGGGFAGSVIALVPKSELARVKEKAREKYGRNNVFLVNIQKY